MNWKEEKLDIFADESTLQGKRDEYIDLHGALWASLRAVVFVRARSCGGN